MTENHAEIMLLVRTRYDGKNWYMESVQAGKLATSRKPLSQRPLVSRMVTRIVQWWSKELTKK